MHIIDMYSGLPEGVITEYNMKAATTLNSICKSPGINDILTKDEWPTCRVGFVLPGISS